jgi:DHA1 family bicyclomycin/chloramphenicol resistance-like MFS transporter
MSVSSSKPAMSPGVVVLILTLMLGSQPITTDLYLPALPTITQGFGASIAQAQLTLTAMLLAFGLSQLVWGPVADRVGRRPVLLLGTLGYAVAAVGGCLAGTMEALIAWRIVLGVAMGAGVMCARAIVRDLYAPAEGARAMSKGLSGLGIIACLSAPLGGVLTEVFGWRVAMLSLAVFGALALAVVAWRFEETIPRRNPDALRPRHLWRTWREILGHPTFWAYTLLATASYSGLFSFLAGSSFVLIQVLGLSKTGYGLLMSSVSFCYVLGTFLCRRLLPRLGVRKTVAFAAVLTLSGGTLMGCLAWAGVQNTWAIVLPYYLFMVAHGVHQPCGQSSAVAPFPHAAGAASALSGFMSNVAAFGIGGWLGRHLRVDSGGSVLPLTNLIWFWTVVIAFVAWVLVRRYGEVRTAPQRVMEQARP